MKLAKRRLLSIILIVAMVFTNTAMAFADDEAALDKEDQKKQEEQLKAKEEAEKKAKEEAEKKAKEEAEKKAKEEAEAKAKAAEEKAEQEADEKADDEQLEQKGDEQPQAEQENSEQEEEQAADNDTSETLMTLESKEDDTEEEDDLKLQDDKLSDGTYKPDSFEFSGGTGKAKVTCDKVIIKGSKIYAEFKASSENMTHFYMGSVSSNAEDTSLYDPSTGKTGKDVYKISNDKTAYVEAVLDEKKPFAGRTTAMEEPHWIQYYYTLKLSDSAKKISDDTTIPEAEKDSGESTGLSNGTYEPDSFEFSGGTGKAKVTCDKVIVKDGKYYGVFTASSDNMTHFYMGAVSSDAEDTSLYDPATDKCGENVYKISKNVAYVPVVLDEQKPFAGRTTAMSEPHWIQYYYKLTLSDSANKISDDTTIPDDSGDSGDDPEDPEDPDDPTDKTKLKDGTYKVKATTDRKMFYLYPKEKNPAKVILVKKNGKMTATITLTGEGYDYVYMGTPAQAKKAGKKNWIKYKKVNGYYTFTIPVSKLDKKLPITPHSSKYESDGDPSTDPWRPDKWILLYSSGAKKVKDGTTINTKKKNSDSSSSGKTDKKAEKESKYKDDSGKSTSAVNNSTSLKDGVYKPDRFNWSGGSGRLAYIRCNKITVRGGKAFATIEFSSSKYPLLKANGRIYSKSGGGNSKFTIPVKLNANNTIIGKTLAMSQPHWVKYRIFIYKKGADAKSGKDSAEGDDGHVTSTKKLSEKAPDLLGLEFKEKVEVKYAKYFNIFKYEQGITLISVDETSKTALQKEETEEADKNGEESGDTDDSGETADGSEEAVEYDEDGKPIAKSQNEVTRELYQNNVVNYLIVPEKVELPAGLEKDCVIIRQPVKASYIASDPILTDIIRLGHLDSVAGISMDIAEVDDKKLKKAVEEGKVQALDNSEKPDYASLVKLEADFAVLPDTVLPAKVNDDSTEDEKKESEELAAKLGTMQSRFAALGVPMIVDRSSDEKTNYATAEWIKVYGAIYGEEDKAKALFDEYVKDNEEEKNA